MNDSQRTYVQTCLDRLRDGDTTAREDLLRGTADRFGQLCRQMLDDYPRLRRWEETGDIFSSAMLRLNNALSKVTPESPRHFYRLAALQIRRELRDLKRHYFGPQGIGANHGTAAGHASDEESNPGALEPPDDTHDPQRIGVWAELHEQVDKLPDAEREAFELIWYHRLTQMETAQVLGVSRRTVIRHWQSACLRLHEVLGSALIERQS